MSSESTSSIPGPDPAHQGKVRWRRFAAMMLSSAGVAAVLVTMTAQGALAASFQYISGIPFVITADHLHGDGFEQWATIDKTKGGKQMGPFIVSGIGNADITNLCQSINLGGTNLKLTAGSPDNHVKATNMVVDSDMLSGTVASFNSINIGQDATTLDQVPGVTAAQQPPVPVGMFGQQAKTVDIDGLRQNNYAATAATFTLPNLHMSFSSTGC